VASHRAHGREGPAGSVEWDYLGSCRLSGGDPQGMPIVAGLDSGEARTPQSGRDPFKEDEVVCSPGSRRWYSGGRPRKARAVPGACPHPVGLPAVESVRGGCACFTGLPGRVSPPGNDQANPSRVQAVNYGGLRAAPPPTGRLVGFRVPEPSATGKGVRRSRMARGPPAGGPTGRWARPPTAACGETRKSSFTRLVLSEMQGG